MPIRNKLLAPHPYCRRCGAVKNLSQGKAYGIGRYANLLARMKYNKKEKLLSDIQVRLILGELKALEGFEDSYVMDREKQEEHFIRAVEKYSSLSKSYIAGFL